MTENEDRLRKTLADIAEMATAVVSSGGLLDQRHEGGQAADRVARECMRLCVPKSLPKRLLVKAAQTAHRINPVNSPRFGPLIKVAADLKIMEPMRIAVITSKYWGPSPRQLTVSFMESTSAELRNRIFSHMNAWAKTACISFVDTSGNGNVRISREPGGYYSYVGTDILHIPQNRQTMNLEAFTIETPESEYRRVVRHETGHTLGFPHEHMRKELVARIDRHKVYDYFLRTYGWDRPTVDAQVLTPLDDASIMGTQVDDTSIMCYQLPGSITVDGQPISGGDDINATDYAFAAKIYPRMDQTHAPGLADDWPESEDVEVPV